MKNHEKKQSGTKCGSDGARKGERKTMPPRGRVIFPSGAAAREVNKKRRAASPFFVWMFRCSPLFASVSAVRARKRRDYSPEFANCQSIGNRGFSSSDSAPSGAAAVFSVPDALLRSPALFADEISYSARSELILVLCTILAKAPISKAER